MIASINKLIPMRMRSTQSPMLHWYTPMKDPSDSPRRISLAKRMMTQSKIKKQGMPKCFPSEI